MGLKAGRVGIHPSQVDPITGMLIGGGPGGASIDDNTISKNTTWSSHKINSELSGKADTSTVSAMYASINENAANILQLATNKADRSDLADVYASINAMALTKLADVTVDDPQDGDYLVYDSTREKWINSGETPAPTYTDLTATIYGAVEDTITFIDAAGVSHSVVFAAGQSSKSETFKINPSGSTSITFTSAVAKDPDNLSANYSKTVTVNSATTDIYVMPDNVFYWYGYISSDLEDCTTANGWSTVKTLSAPTHNKNNIYISTSGTTYCGVGTKVQLASGKVINVITESSLLIRLYKAPSKVINESAIYENFVTALTKSNYTLTETYSNIAFGMDGGSRNITLYAMWYE